MKTKCDCCGTCCRKGGPPLHSQDIELVRSGLLTFDNLVTIGSGELVTHPLDSKAVPAQSEWIKVQGIGGDWCCRFLDKVLNKCTIYSHRPVSCKKLKCWDPDEILAMAGKDLLTRFDLIENDDPVLNLIRLPKYVCCNCQLTP